MGIFSLITVPVKMHRHLFSVLPDTFVEGEIRRYAATIERPMYHREQKDKHKKKEGEERGNIHDVINAEKDLLKHVLKKEEKLELEKILPKEDTVINDILQKLKECAEAIAKSRDKSSTILEARQFLKRAGEDIENLLKMDIAKIQRIKDGSVVYTSLESFDEGSVAAIIAGEAVKERRRIRKIKSDVNHIMANIRDIPNVKKREKAEEIIRDDAKNLESDVAAFAASAGVMILRTVDLILFLEHAVREEEGDIKKYIKEGFPEKDADAMLKACQKLIETIHTDEGQEIMRLRVVLSEAQREEAMAT